MKFRFNDGEEVTSGSEVKFLDQVGKVITIFEQYIRVEFKYQTICFGKNKKLLGFQNENLLEVVKDLYQVLYNNGSGIYNTTTTKVNNIAEAIGLIEYDNERVANPRKVIGLIDKDGKVIYNEQLKDGKE